MTVLKMKKAGLLTALVLSVAAVFGGGLAAQTVTYPMNQNTTPLTSVGVGWAYNFGHEFTVNVGGIVVTQLGCLVSDGNGKTVTLWDALTQTKVAQVMTSGGSSGATWRFANLPTPVSLLQGRNYIIAVTLLSSGGCSYNSMVAPGTAPWWPSTQHVSWVQGRGVNTNDPNIFPNSIWSNIAYGMADIGYVRLPILTCTATAGTQVQLYPGSQGPTGDGEVVGRFQLAANNVDNQTAQIVSMTLQGSGSGNHATAYTSIQIYRDEDADGILNTAVDVLLSTQAALDDLGSTKVFPLTESIPPNQTRRFLIVVKLNGTASFGQTFSYAVTAIDTNNTALATGLPSGIMTGFVITHSPFFLTSHSPGTAGTAKANGMLHVIMDFSVDYPQGAQRSIISMTFLASGTGNDVSDLDEVALYRDDGDGLFDEGTDTLVDTDTSYLFDNGQITMDFPLAEQAINATEVKRYFFVYRFSRYITPGLTFRAQLIDLVEQTVGLSMVPDPLPFTGPVAGVIVENHNLNFILVGPMVPTAVPNNAQGDLNKGLVLLTVDVVAYSTSWVVTHFTIRASGTGLDNNAYNSVALMEDGNGNGTYEGLPQDRLASDNPPSAFPTDDGDYVAMLNSGGAGTTFAAGTTRRFFVVVKLIGTAVPGQTFNAEIADITAVNPPPLSDGDFEPSQPSMALIIDVPLLTVGLGSGSPASTSREKGDDFAYVLAKFRFTVAGAPAVLNSIRLTSYGSGDFASDLSGSNGIEIWLDNGNGIFDGDVPDTLIWYGPAGSLATQCNFGLNAVTIPNGASRDLWVRINVLSSAGGSIPSTFQVAIETPFDVDGGPGTNVVLAAEAPVSGTLSVVLFSVEQFQPLTSYQEGGDNIVIVGTGFSSPVTLKIGGVTCPGTAVVSSDGRQISGLTVPAGTGKNLAIHLKTGGLTERMLPMKFSYAGGSVINHYDIAKTCAVTSGEGLAWLALPALLVLAVYRRRRMARN